jgi:hypothetical protein
MEKGYYFPRNIPLREYIDDIGQLKWGAPWKWLHDTRVKVKGGLFIPTDVNVEYVKHSWDKEIKRVTRARNSVRTVRTYLNKGIKKSRSKSKKNHVTINI